MPIDYSKWDKIELSDDSDIEVHPNVDKKSFIKWKQRDIHEKRAQRNIEIKAALIQLTMYAKLNERVDYILEQLTPSELVDLNKVSQVLDQKFDKKEQFDYEQLKKSKGSDLKKGLRDLTFDEEEMKSMPPYNEMVEDLFIQIKEDHQDAANDGEKLLTYLKEHRLKIVDVLSKQATHLDELLYQKSLLITSDDVHTGWDKSFLNKYTEEEVKETPKQTETVTTVETINSPSAVEPKDILDDLQATPETLEFGKISLKQTEESQKFLLQHPFICTENQKDALIMTAFDAQLEGDSKRAKNIIHQSLLLQYVATLAGPKPGKELILRAIKLFFSKVADGAARGPFLQDVEQTFEHIKTRCKVIEQEQAEKTGGNEEEQIIQLKALDDGTELFVNIPEEGTTEYSVFKEKLTPDMQAAILTGKMDQVNKLFALMSVEDAEHVLEVFNECGVIGINGVMENEAEFEELKEKYEHEHEHEHEHEPVEQGAELSTVDTVD